MDTSTAQFQKIIFKLTVDADGYPPVEYESMWGVQRGADVYQLDNTPYYLYGVSKGDWVLTRADAHERIATRVVRQSGHSTLRVFAERESERSGIVQHLRSLGARCTVTRGLSLFTVDIAPEVSFSAIDQYLASITDDQYVAYEDACLQHEAIEPARLSECSSLASVECVTWAGSLGAVLAPELRDDPAIEQARSRCVYRSVDPATRLSRFGSFHSL